MTKTKKILSIVLAVVVVLTGMAAIVGDKSVSNNSYETKEAEYDLADGIYLTAYEETYVSNDSKSTEAVKSTEKSDKLYSPDRKIIRNASLTLSTEKYADTLSSIENKTIELSGYVESANENKYDDFTYTRLTVRIPEENLDKFLESVSGYATVTSKSISTDDVTLTYVDNESHLKALRSEQETLMGLLEKATNLSDVITIQDRLTNVRADIEYYESTLNRLDNEIEYSTVEITIDEVSHESATGVGFWAEIGAGLKESLYNIGEGFKTIFKTIVIGLPYLIIFAIIFVVLYVIIKKKIKQRRAKSGRQADSESIPTAQ